MSVDYLMTPAEFAARRAELGLTMRALAVRLGVNPATVNRWEQGHSRIPGPVAIALASLSAVPVPAPKV